MPKSGAVPVAKAARPWHQKVTQSNFKKPIAVHKKLVRYMCIDLNECIDKALKNHGAVRKQCSKGCKKRQKWIKAVATATER